MLARNPIETKSGRIEQAKGRTSGIQCNIPCGGLQIEPYHVAEYVSDMLRELHDLSIQVNLRALARLIEAARLEADEHRQL
jgi:hypothetical protein